MGLREDLLPSIQAIRDIAVGMGLRRYEAWVRLVVWNGSRIGVGTSTTTDTYLGRVKTRVVSSEDVVAGSVMSDATFELGPFTPENSAGLAIADTKALSPDALSPPQTGSATEIYYLLKGPGLPTDGLLCQRVGDDTSKPFRYTVTIKSTGRKAT